jgi:enoyl-CoA hydratase
VRIVLNRPDKLNAISHELREALVAAVADAATDDAIRVIVIAGAGRAFCAGYDLAEEAPSTALGWRDELARDVEATLAIWRCPKPVIAQVHGYCLAGGLDGVRPGRRRRRCAARRARDPLRLGAGDAPDAVPARAEEDA